MKIGAVVVTYNRLDKLKKALKSFEDQQYLPVYVIVVNNASTDTTAQYLQQWQEKMQDLKNHPYHEKQYWRKRRILCWDQKGHGTGSRLDLGIR